MKNYDVVALGEVLIDFVENGVSKEGNVLYEANPGGAPCNVLAMLGKLGHPAAFIGKVGEDAFGHSLKASLETAGITTDGLVFDKAAPTTLAFVHNAADGEREFSFYRQQGADTMLEESEVNENLIEDGRIFHYGSLSMTHKSCRKATKKAIEAAEKAQVLLSFDPNLRAALWESLEEAKHHILYGIRHCRILKVAEEELLWISGEKDIDSGIKKLREIADIPLILVTLGKEGSMAYYKDLQVSAPAYLQKNTIDTTGAGDTFFACILHFVLDYGIENLSKERIENMLSYANGAASIVTTRKGALLSMPEQEEILELVGG
ncbi:fructokinase [Clostridia bacterium]|nr:fructokinase [Clostridia bacterium]